MTQMMPRAFVCSPLRPAAYAHPSNSHLSEADKKALYDEELEFNLETTRRLCAWAMKLGYAPFAPHLIYPQFLDPADPKEDALGQAAGQSFMQACDVLVVLESGRGITQGMAAELKLAEHYGEHGKDLVWVKLEELWPAASTIAAYDSGSPTYNPGVLALYKSLEAPE